MPILQRRRPKFHELKSHDENTSSCQQSLRTCYALGRPLMLDLCHLIESPNSSVRAGPLPTFHKLVNRDTELKEQAKHELIWFPTTFAIFFFPSHCSQHLNCARQRTHHLISFLKSLSSTQKLLENEGKWPGVLCV